MVICGKIKTVLQKEPLPKLIHILVSINIIQNWPSNYMGLNCVNPLIMDFLSINTVSPGNLPFPIQNNIFHQWLGSLICARMTVSRFYTILYKGLKHPWIVVFIGILEPIPRKDRKPTVIKFTQSQNYRTGGEGMGAANPVFFKDQL